MAVTFAIWGSFDSKGLIIFVFSLIFFEALFLVKSRLSVECIHCGFDPHLYLRDRGLACEKVRVHLAKRIDDPDVWLARKAPIHLPKRSRPKKSKYEVVA